MPSSEISRNCGSTISAVKLALQLSVLSNFMNIDFSPCLPDFGLRKSGPNSERDFDVSTSICTVNDGDFTKSIGEFAKLCASEAGDCTVQETLPSDSSLP